MNYVQLANQAKDGETNPLSVYIQLKRAEKELKAAIELVQPLAIDEADKYSEKTFKFQGAVIEKKSAPSTWDFSEVAAYTQAKERLKYIETISKAGGGADANTGEVIDKAIKIDGKSTITVKLPHE